ncbi:MAG: hypothetical protein R3E87_04795 [Burkholderiaceae bacterium]
MLDMSAGEFTALVRKAALGAGLEHGLAIEFADAAAALAAAQPDTIGDAVVAALLEQGVAKAPTRTGDGQWTLAPGPIVRLAPTAIDLALAEPHGGAVRLPIGTPLAWLAAYVGSRPLAAPVRLEFVVSAESEGAGTETAEHGLGAAETGAATGQVLDPEGCLRGAAGRSRGAVSVRASRGEAWRCARADRVSLGDAALGDLLRWATETTVPTSEYSRARGAGADLDDNL